MEPKRRLTVRLVRPFWSGKSSQVELFPIGPNHCTPRKLVSLVVPNPFKSRSICSWESLVPYILSGSCRAKIGASVVQSIAIDVIPVHAVARGKAKNFPMHQDGSSLSGTMVGTAGIVRLKALVISGAPSISRETSVVFRVNNCELAASKKDNAVGFGEWERHAGAPSCRAIAGCFRTRRSHFTVKSRLFYSKSYSAQCHSRVTTEEAHGKAAR
jgi:hypothetical protein